MANRFIYLALLISSSCLIANPSGPTVVEGGATFSGLGSSSTTINSTQVVTAIDWNTFSIDAGQTVTFQKSGAPVANYYILNNVTGGAASNIAGLLTTSGAGIGNIYLINPAGITVASTGQIIAGSFLASTLQLVGGTAAFDPVNNPDMLFTGASTFSVTNGGQIQSLNGDVTLIGYRVVNSGSIISANAVALGAGVSILYQPSTSERIFIEASGAALGVGTGIDSAGTISGLDVILKADANPYALAINHTGSTSLTSCSPGGSLLIQTVNVGSPCAVDGGAISIVGGTLTSTGCPIIIEGRTIAIQDSSLISASSTTGSGGNIRIGTIVSACPTTNIYIDSTSKVVSNAPNVGTGGTISVAARDSLLIVGNDSNGNIQAAGNLFTGTGGSVGLISSGYLGLDAFVNVSGLTMGTLQVNAPNINVGGVANYGTHFAAPNYSEINASPVITTAAVEYSLNHGNLTVVALDSDSLGVITVADNFSWTTGTLLTLEAVGAIQVNYLGQMTSASVIPNTNLVLSMQAPSINIGPSQGNSSVSTGFQLESGSISVVAAELLGLYGGNLANTVAKISTKSGTQAISFGDQLIFEAGSATGANAEMKGTIITIDTETGGAGQMTITASNCGKAFVDSPQITIGGTEPLTSLSILGGCCAANNEAYIGSNNSIGSNIAVSLVGDLTLSAGTLGSGNNASIISSGGISKAITVSARDVIILGGVSGMSNQARIASLGVLGSVHITTAKDLIITGESGAAGSAYIYGTTVSFSAGRDVLITGGTANGSRGYIQATSHIRGDISRFLTVQGGSSINAGAEIITSNGNIVLNALTDDAQFGFFGGNIPGLNNSYSRVMVTQNGNISIGRNGTPNYVSLKGGSGNSNPYASIGILGNGDIYVKTLLDISYLGGRDGASTHASVHVDGTGNITHIAGRDMNLATGNNSPANAYLEVQNGGITVQTVRDLNMTGDCYVPNYAYLNALGTNSLMTVLVGRDLTMTGHAYIHVQNPTGLVLQVSHRITVEDCSSVIEGERVIYPVPPTPAAVTVPVLPADEWYRYIFLYEFMYRLNYFKCYDWFVFHGNSFWDSTMYTDPNN